MAMRPYDTVIFDLDGTLLDTLGDLADSTNYALALHGLPARTLEEVRQFVGNGVAVCSIWPCPAVPRRSWRRAVWLIFGPTTC